jgi:hypothetical protein
MYIEYKFRIYIEILQALKLNVVPYPWVDFSCAFKNTPISNPSLKYAHI